MEDTCGEAVPVILFSIFLSIVLRLPVIPVVPVVPVLAAWQAGNHPSWVWVKRRIFSKKSQNVMIYYDTGRKLWAPADLCRFGINETFNVFQTMEL